MDTIDTIFIEIEEWADLLFGQICICYDDEVHSIRNEVENVQQITLGMGMIIKLQQGYNLSQTLTMVEIKLKREAHQALFKNCIYSEFFPKIFSLLLMITHSLFSLELQDENKQGPKALHTEAIISKENLTEVEKLEISIFEYLSNMLLESAKNGPQNIELIDVKAVESIFFFMNYNRPNSVRLSAGQIIGALSATPNHLESICELFWKKYATLKKDIEYRNFATWIDGMVHLQFGLNDSKQESITITFFDSFFAVQKKIDRGVLRMKFLTAFETIVERLSRSPKALGCISFMTRLEELWDVITKWSKRSKHTSFCLESMANILIKAPLPFCQKHAINLFGMICRELKEENINYLKLLTKIIKELPQEFVVQIKTFGHIFKSVLIPTLYGRNPNKRSINVETAECYVELVRITAAIGSRNIGILADFILSVFNVEKPADEHIVVMRTMIRALSLVGDTKPENLVAAGPLLGPIIERLILTKSDIIRFALMSFPTLRSSTENTTNSAIVALDLASRTDELGDAAINALSRWVKECVTFANGADVFAEMLTKVVESVQNDHTEEHAKHALFVILKMVENLNIEGEVPKLKQDMRETKFTTTYWEVVRIKLDQITIQFALSGSDELSKTAISIQSSLKKAALFDEVARYEKPLSQYFPDTLIKEFPLVAAWFAADNPINAEMIFKESLPYLDYSNDQWSLFVGGLTSKEGNESKAYFTNLIRENVELVGKVFKYSSPSVWVFFINLLQQTKESENLDIFAEIYYRISSRAEFETEMEKNDILVQKFAAFINAFLANPSTKRERFMDALKNYAKYAPKKLTAVHGCLTDAFYRSITECIPTDTESETLSESALECFETLFSVCRFQTTGGFETFADWLSEFSVSHSNKEHIQELIVRALTAVIAGDQRMLKEAFSASIAAPSVAAPHFILSIANTFCRKDFFERYHRGPAVVLSTITAHISNHSVVCRQASLKLFVIAATKSNSESIFTKSFPVELAMTLSSECDIGHNLQAESFVEFAGHGVLPKVALAVVDLFAEYVQMFGERQSEVVQLLEPFAALLPPGSRSVRSLLTLTMALDDDVEVEAASHRLWVSFFNSFKGSTRESTDLAHTVFEFGASQSSGQSREAVATARLLSDVYRICPQEVSTILIRELSSSNRSFPKTLTNLWAYMNQSDVRLTPTVREIVASNAISNILLQIDSIDEFNSCFRKHLPILAYFGITMSHVDELAFGAFHPLLDALLDSVVLKHSFCGTNFTSKLQTLHNSNLLTNASTLEQTLSVAMDRPVRQVLCYDIGAVTAICDAMTYALDDFKQRFLEIVLANAFRVSRSDRSMEPLMLTMSLQEEITEENAFQLILFGVHAIKNGRDELLDALVDLLKGRAEGESSIEECLGVVALFVLMLAHSGLKKSFVVSLIGALESVLRGYLSSGSGAELAAAIAEFFDRFGGERFVCGMVIKFVEDARSLADQIVTSAISLLNAISKIYEDSLCGLVSSLLEVTRYNISDGRIGEPNCPTDPNEFLEFVSSNYGNKYNTDVAEFLVSLTTRFRTLDLKVDGFAMSLLSNHLHKNGCADGADINYLASMVFVTSFSTEEGVREASAKALSALPLERANACDMNLVSIPEKLATFIKKPAGGWQKEEVIAVDKAKISSRPLFKRDPDIEGITEVILKFVDRHISDNEIEEDTPHEDEEDAAADGGEEEAAKEESDSESDGGGAVEVDVFIPPRIITMSNSVAESESDDEKENAFNSISVFDSLSPVSEDAIRIRATALNVQSYLRSFEPLPNVHIDLGIAPLSFEVTPEMRAMYSNQSVCDRSN